MGRILFFFLLFSVGIFLLAPGSRLQAWPSLYYFPVYPVQEARYVVIVEPISSGNQLAAAVRARGYFPIAVRSEVEFSPRLEAGFKPNDFSPANIFNIREQDYASILKSLQARDIALVLPGSEMGVPLAYQLAQDLKRESNPTETIQLHRDKFSAQSALWANGLPHIPSALATSEKGLGPWLGINGGFEKLGKLVVKPRDSHGGDLVQVVASEDELRVAIKNILTTKNASNRLNNAVLVQQFISGEEYAVNGAVTTINGRLYIRITDVWRYNKSINEAGYPQYGYEELLAWEEIPEPVLKLLPKILKALQFRVGAFHSEIKVTPEGGAVMIETAARLYGAGNTRIAGAATDYSQINATLDSYLNTAGFLRKAEKPYRRNSLALVYNINTPPSEKPLMARDASMSAVRKRLRRPWFRSDLFHLVPFYKDGQRLDPTNSLLSTFGEIEILIPDDKKGAGRDRCRKALEYLFDLERSGHFWVPASK